jgi:hypothetical protein
LKNVFVVVRFSRSNVFFCFFNNRDRIFFAGFFRSWKLKSPNPYRLILRSGFAVLCKN